MTKLSFIIALALTSSISSAKTISYQQLANNYLTELVSEDHGIGAREAGTDKEALTAAYLAKELSQMGYQVTEQVFTFGSKQQRSKNLIVDSAPKLSKTIILGAHYDSTGADQGSLGATDNGAGVAALLALAKALKAHPPAKVNIRFIAFGAEEAGVFGSKHYVKSLNLPDANQKIIAMINLDTIAGGDLLYVHSAHHKAYQCNGDQQYYNHSTQIRDALLAASSAVLGKEKQHILHPAYDGYPEGETGPWSDHTPFACAGIATAYIESTNFSINGKDGFDGYSQTINPKLWNCYDTKQHTACDRKAEKHWGKIWHTQYDSLSQLEQLFPQRVSQQLADNISVLLEFLTQPEHYLDGKISNEL